MTSAGFGPALKQALVDANRTIQALADELGLPHSTVSTWVSKDRPPDPSMVFAIEQALDLAAGSLSRLLGYLPVDAVPAVTVADAAEQDPWLTRDQRDDLVAVWETMRARTRARRELRSTPGDR